MRVENSFKKAHNYLKTFGLVNETFIKFLIKFLIRTKIFVSWKNYVEIFIDKRSSKKFTDCQKTNLQN